MISHGRCDYFVSILYFNLPSAEVLGFIHYFAVKIQKTMKFHWGTGIAVVTGLFMAMILGFVIQSFQHDTELVSDDYYAQELAYQTRIDQKANAGDIDVKVSFDEQGMILVYPEGASAWKGGVEFFRPSDKALDFSEAITLDDAGQQRIQADNLITGLWKVKFTWEEGGKSYYMEKSIVAP